MFPHGTVPDQGDTVCLATLIVAGSKLFPAHLVTALKIGMGSKGKRNRVPNALSHSGRYLLLRTACVPSAQLAEQAGKSDDDSGDKC